MRSYRWQLTPGEDVIDPATFAGSIPQVNGIAPRVRVGRSRWFNLLWLLPIGFVLLLDCGRRGQGPARRARRCSGSSRATPGRSRRRTPTRRRAFPPGRAGSTSSTCSSWSSSSARACRSCPTIRGCTGRGTRTPGRDWFRIQKPVPADPLWTAKQDSISLPGQVGLPGLAPLDRPGTLVASGRRRVWLLNGVVFFVLLFATDRWQRLVPTSWDVFPNALSVLIQYLSLDWPTENGWVAYNGLQLIAYFVTVFVAAPLALVTGLGMSPALSTRFRRISSVLSIQTARSLHFLVLVWFLLFIVMHVTFVFTTGLLVNLNHVYAGRTDDSWVGFWLFAASMVDRRSSDGSPPRRSRSAIRASCSASARRSSDRCSTSSSTSTPSRASTREKDISPYFWHNGQYPDSDEYKALFDGHFADYRLRIDGLVDQPRRARPGAAASAAPPRADHPALLHPGLVRRRQVGRRLDADDRRPRQAAARGEVGRLLLARRRSGQGRLLRRAPDRAHEPPPHDARLRHERRAAVRSATARRCGSATRSSSASSRSSGSKASSSSPTTPRSAAATAATTKTTSSSATGSPSEAQNKRDPARQTMGRDAREISAR